MSNVTNPDSIVIQKVNNGWMVVLNIMPKIMTMEDQTKIQAQIFKEEMASEESDVDRLIKGKTNDGGGKAGKEGEIAYDINKIKNVFVFCNYGEVLDFLTYRIKD